MYQNLHDTRLKTGGQVVRIDVIPFLARIMDSIDDGTFQSAEAEIIIVLFDHSARKMHRFFTFMSHFIHFFPAWIRQAQNASDFVVSLSRSIIPRFADDVERAVLFHIHQFRMPSADNQGQQGIAHRRHQLVRINMAGHMIDRNERFLMRKSQRLRCTDADQQRADQPWTMRYRNRIDCIESDLGLMQCRFNDLGDLLDMMTARHFRHDPAKAHMAFDLGSDNIRKDRISVFHHSYTCFIATALNREYGHICFRHQSSASSLFSDVSANSMM